MARLDFAVIGTSLSATKAWLKPWTSLRQFMFEGAKVRRAHLNAEIAAVAGSAGKTTVKEMLGSILKSWSAATGRPSHISVANQNTKLALAMQILRIPEKCAVAVFEVGARRVGDFQIPLSYLQPQIVTLLNVGTAHAGEFGSIENLRAEKLSILNAPSADILVVPSDDKLIYEYAKTCDRTLMTFGYAEGSSVQIIDDSPVGLMLKIQNDIIEFSCPFNGPKRALNIAASVATSLALGFSIFDIQQGLKNFAGVSRRFESFQWKGRHAIDDAFNASPESMREGLAHLKSQFQNKHAVLVIGSMLELGPYSESEHRTLGQFVAETMKDTPWSLITVGEEARFIADEAQNALPESQVVKHFASSAEAREEVESLATAADIVYFKGSKGIQLQKIFSAP